MTQFYAHTPNADCFVLTYKEGLLSPMAHDLRLKVTSWQMTIDGSTIEATFFANSLQVDSVIRDGREAPGVLGQDDRAKIARSIRETVLEAERYPDIAFLAEDIKVTGDTATMRCLLTIKGRTKRMSISAKQVGDRWVAEVVLHQPDFGIKPYTAMFGTLKIKPDVTVRMSLPAGAW